VVLYKAYKVVTPIVVGDHVAKNIVYIWQYNMISFVASVLGAAAGGVSTEPQSDREIVLKETLGYGAFSGKIVPIALTPQPQPPIVYKLGSDAGKGGFSGQIVSLTIKPQTEPLAIGRINMQSL
jgi:hypothetical protein